MKRLSSVSRIRFARVSEKRFEKRLRRKHRKSERGATIPLLPPEVLSFRRNPVETIDFLNRFKSLQLRIFNQYKRFQHAKDRTSPTIYIDFRRVRTLSKGVAVVLSAELHRWQLLRGNRMSLRSLKSWNPAVRSMLTELGAFDLLNVQVKRSSIDTFDPEVTFIPLVSDRLTDGAKVNGIQTKLQQTLKRFKARESLYGALMEAVENVVLHAYPPDVVPVYPYAGKLWWATACIDFEQERLRFFVYDVGVGIPNTLPSKAYYERVRTWADKNIPEFAHELVGGAMRNDAVMLKAAIEFGRSNTGLVHRGRGLPAMIAAIDEAGVGSFRILSGAAELRFKSGEPKLETSNFHAHIGGTLIEFDIPLSVFGASVGDSDYEN